MKIQIRLQNPHNRKVANLCRSLQQLNNSQKLNSKSQLLKYIGCNQEFMIEWLVYSKRRNCPNDAKVHIDYLVPLQRIRPFIEEDFGEIFNWKNIRVVPAKVNLVKYDNSPTEIELKQQQCDIENFVNMTR